MRMTCVLNLILVAAATSVGATTIVPADLGELSRDAVAIARGRVADVRSQWTEDRGTVETIVTLEVEGYLKGSLGAMVRFRVPGGELGRYRTIVVGAPDFAVDQRVVVFLGAHGPTVPHIVGFNQGVFRVTRAADDSGWVVSPPPAAAAAAAVRIVRGDAARRPLPLADFEQQVRTLAGAAR
jgi:hypothetical protein